MSNKDIKKGIAIQAKADAEKIEKLAKGLNAHRSVLSNLESGQTEIRDAMGIVLDDMSAGEAKYLYDLQVKKTPDELDLTEKRVLCACIYTLLSTCGQDTPSQVIFYSNLEKYLGVSERKQDFDFYSLNHVDSHTDRLVILKTICSFLFLKQESFSFLREKEAFSWLFAFASVKDIGDICSAINEEYAVLGINGILDCYDPILAPSKSAEERFYAIASPEEESPKLEEEPEYNYNELSQLIVERVSDEAAFGKGIAFTEKDFRKELTKDYANVSFDSLVAAAKIEKGFLFFTTYALYLKPSSVFSNNYVCLPYRSILTDSITTTEGKQTGTRKLLVPMNVNGQHRMITIDDAVLQEEKLRDLLVAIAESSFSIPETDRIVTIKELSGESKRNLLAAVVYVLRTASLPLADAFVLSNKWGIIDYWNEIANVCDSDESFNRLAKEYIKAIPYPSKRVTSFETVNLLLALISHANEMTGREATILSLKEEKEVLCFASGSIDNNEFSRMIHKSVGKISGNAYRDYLSIRDAVSEGETSYSELIIPFVDSCISSTESGLDFKAKAAIKKSAKGVGQLAGAVHGKVKQNAKTIIQKSTKGVSQLTSTLQSKVKENMDRVQKNKNKGGNDEHD